MNNIRLGNTYKVKYLSPFSYKVEEIKPANVGFVESYEISNLPNNQIFKGVLNILADGRAIMKAKYDTYSGVKNNFTNYFDTDGREIIHTNDSTNEEKKYFNTLK